MSKEKEYTIKELDEIAQGIEIPVIRNLEDRDVVGAEVMRLLMESSGVVEDAVKMRVWMDAVIAWECENQEVCNIADGAEFKLKDNTNVKIKFKE